MAQLTGKTTAQARRPSPVRPEPLRPNACSSMLAEMRLDSKPRPIIPKWPRAQFSEVRSRSPRSAWVAATRPARELLRESRRSFPEPSSWASFRTFGISQRLRRTTISQSKIVESYWLRWLLFDVIQLKSPGSAAGTSESGGLNATSPMPFPASWVRHFAVKHGLGAGESPASATLDCSRWALRQKLCCMPSANPLVLAAPRSW